MENNSTLDLIAHINVIHQLLEHLCERAHTRGNLRAVRDELMSDIQDGPLPFIFADSAPEDVIVIQKLAGQIMDSFLRRIEKLPYDSRVQ